MRINYLSSYDRSFKRLTSSQQEKCIKVTDALIEFIQTGKKTQKLDLKKIRKNYWEIRLDVKNRIIFEFEQDVINIVFAGGHAGVKKLLREPRK